MDQPRFFVAVPLPERLKRLLSDSVTAFKQELPLRKWTHPDDYHLTLKFLGATEDSLLPELANRLAACASRSTPFSLAAAGAGTFGKPSAPSVLWASVEGDLRQLGSLQADVERSAEQLGFAAEDRPYQPHITLARRFDASAGEWNANPLSELGERIGKEADGRWTVDEIVLYQSHLNRSPMYEPIRRWTLGAREI